MLTFSRNHVSRQLDLKKSDLKANDTENELKNYIVRIIRLRQSEMDQMFVVLMDQFSIQALQNHSPLIPAKPIIWSKAAFRFPA
jgi:hypothetical protein